MRNLLIVLVLVMASPAVADDVTRRITVVGQGSVEVVPDMATVSMGVITEAKTGAAAMAQNSDTLAGVMKQLTEAGGGGARRADQQSVAFAAVGQQPVQQHGAT